MWYYRTSSAGAQPKTPMQLVWHWRTKMTSGTWSKSWSSFRPFQWIFYCGPQGRFWQQSMWRAASRYRWRKANTRGFRSQSGWRYHFISLLNDLKWRPLENVPANFSVSELLTLCVLTFLSVPSSSVMPILSADTWLGSFQPLGSMEPTLWSRLRCVCFYLCVMHSIRLGCLIFLSGTCRLITGWSSVLSVCVDNLVWLRHCLNWIKSFPCGPSWLDMPSPWLTCLSGLPSKVFLIVCFSVELYVAKWANNAELHVVGFVFSLYRSQRLARPEQILLPYQSLVLVPELPGSLHCCEQQVYKKECSCEQIQCKCHFTQYQLIWYYNPISKKVGQLETDTQRFFPSLKIPRKTDYLAWKGLKL